MSKFQKEGDHDAILELWQRALLKTAVMFFPLFVFLMASARPFIVIFFTDVYERATPIFMIYLFLFLRSTVETGTVIQVFKRTRYIAKVFIVGFVFNLALSLILFQVMDREGVALATVVTMYLVNLANLLYASRLLNTRLRQLFPGAAVVKRLAVAVIPGVPLWFAIRAVNVDNVFELAGFGVAYMGIYFALCSRVGYITLDDVKSMLGKKPI
jgi:O-antigen/teichoic acid export membrane protein